MNKFEELELLESKVLKEINIPEMEELNKSNLDLIIQQVYDRMDALQEMQTFIDNLTEEEIGQLDELILKRKLNLKIY